MSLCADAKDIKAAGESECTERERVTDLCRALAILGHNSDETGSDAITTEKCTAKVTGSTHVLCQWEMSIIS